MARNHLLIVNSILKWESKKMNIKKNALYLHNDQLAAILLAKIVINSQIYEL